MNGEQGQDLAVGAPGRVTGDLLALVPDQSTPALLRLYDAVLRELARREVVRSTNNPIADYAEWLAARALGLTLEGKSAKGFDAVGPAPDRLRYQIKARRPTPANPSRQLSFIRGLDRDPFDILLGVLFTPGLEVLRAASVPVAVVRQEARFVPQVNGWRFILRDSVWDLPGVIDVTAPLRATEQGSSNVIPLGPPHEGAGVDLAGGTGVGVLDRRLLAEPATRRSPTGAPAAPGTGSLKTCTACGQTFPATRDHFYRWSRDGALVGDGWYPVHKACYRARRLARAARVEP